jgi:hypothetical protein
MNLGLLILCGAAIVFLALRLGLDMAGISVRGLRRRAGPGGAGFRWIGLAALLIEGMLFGDVFVSYRNWPYSHRHEVSAYGLLLALVALALGLIGSILASRAKAAARAAAAQPPVS